MTTKYYFKRNCIKCKECDYKGFVRGADVTELMNRFISHFIPLGLTPEEIKQIVQGIE